MRSPADASSRETSTMSASKNNDLAPRLSPSRIAAVSDGIVARTSRPSLVSVSAQDCAVAIVRVDDQRIHSAEVLNEASCHLTTLKLGGAHPRASWIPAKPNRDRA